MPQTILVVDDSLFMRGLLRSAFDHADHGRFDVLETSTADEALALMTNARVDLIVTDFHMPGVDGLEFVRRLRHHDAVALRSVPIVMVSSNNDAALRKRALLAGVTAFQAKPFRPEDLAALVRKLLLPVARV